MVEDLDLDKDGVVEKYEIDAYMRKTQAIRYISYGAGALFALITAWALFYADVASVEGKKELLSNMIFVIASVIMANFGITAWQDKFSKH